MAFASIVYDMGATHPTETSAPVSFVGSARDLVFLNDLAEGEGIGAFSVYACGMGGALGETGMDADNVLIDNIRTISFVGTVLTIR